MTRWISPFLALLHRHEHTKQQITQKCHPSRLYSSSEIPHFSLPTHTHTLPVVAGRRPLMAPGASRSSVMRESRRRRDVSAVTRCSGGRRAREGQQRRGAQHTGGVVARRWRHGERTWEQCVGGPGSRTSGTGAAGERHDGSARRGLRRVGARAARHSEHGELVRTLP